MGQAVTVALGFEQKAVSADGNGRWAAVLSPREPGEPLTLTITSGAGAMTCADVAVGEVWLAGGQSNMEMPLRDCRGGKKEISASAGKNVRFYRVPRCAMAGEELERMEAEGRWQVCAPETSGDRVDVLALRMIGTIGTAQLDETLPIAPSAGGCDAEFR